MTGELAREMTGVVIAAVLAALASCGGPPAPTDTHPTRAAVPPGTPAPPAVPAPPPTAVAPPSTPSPPTTDPPVTAPPVADAPPITPPPVAAPAQPACPPQVPAGASLADRLDLFKKTCGGVLLLTREDGLHAVTTTLDPIAQVTTSAVRWVQPRREGDARELYFFAADAPELVRLDLRSGKEEVLVRLPRLKHPCFTNAGPDEPAEPADPVEFIQWAADLDLDVAGGVLCLDVGDRNVNMASLQVNFRADLKTGKVEQRTVFIGDECKTGAGRERKPACEPRPKDWPSQREIAEIEQSGLVSPSGRWAFYSDDMFQDGGDYIYTSAFLRDTTEHISYAITPARLVKIDFKRRSAEKGPPAGTCMLAGEAMVRWLPDRDVLIVDGCGDQGWLIVEPPGRVQPLAAAAVAIYP